MSETKNKGISRRKLLLGAAGTLGGLLVPSLLSEATSAETASQRGLPQSNQVSQPIVEYGNDGGIVKSIDLNTPEGLESFLDLGFGNYSNFRESGSERFLEELHDGDDEVFDFDIIALPTAVAGVYKIPVEITY